MILLACILLPLYHERPDLALVAAGCYALIHALHRIVRGRGLWIP